MPATSKDQCDHQPRCAPAINPNQIALKNCATNGSTRRHDCGGPVTKAVAQANGNSGTVVSAVNTNMVTAPCHQPPLMAAIPKARMGKPQGNKANKSPNKGDRSHGRCCHVRETAAARRAMVGEMGIATPDAVAIATALNKQNPTPPATSAPPATAGRLRCPAKCRALQRLLPQRHRPPRDRTDKAATALLLATIAQAAPRPQDQNENQPPRAHTSRRNGQESSRTTVKPAQEPAPSLKQELIQARATWPQRRQGGQQSDICKSWVSQ